MAEILLATPSLLLNKLRVKKSEQMNSVQMASITTGLKLQQISITISISISITTGIYLDLKFLVVQYLPFLWLVQLYRMF